MEFWGAEAILLIRRADRVEILLLGDEEESLREGSEQLLIEGRMRDVLQSQDLLSGGVMMRNALVEDKSFSWNAPRGAAPIRWRYGLRLSDEDRQAILAFDLENARARLVQSDQEVSVKPIIIGLKKFFEGHFPPEDAAAKNGAPPPE